MFKGGDGMKILVTGGAGFIGSHLVEKLVFQGNDVVVIDNCSTGYLSNLSCVADKITVIETNLEDYDLAEVQNCDIVFHLAAQTSVPLSIEKFGESSKHNLLGSIKIIDHCAVNQIPLIYASSSAVYGDLHIGDDRCSDVDLSSPYAADKYVMEVYASLAYKLYKLPSIGLRFFNVYGPRQDPTSPYSGVISIFVKNIKYGQTTTINGGHQTRDFVYVGDVVDALEGSIKHLIDNKTCDVANVLSGSSISIDVLFEVLCKVLHKTSSVERKPLGLGDALKSEGTVDKMNSIVPKLAKTITSLEAGLRKTIAEPDHD